MKWKTNDFREKGDRTKRLKRKGIDIIKTQKRRVHGLFTLILCFPTGLLSVTKCVNGELPSLYFFLSLGNRRTSNLCPTCRLVGRLVCATNIVPFVYFLPVL